MVRTLIMRMVYTWQKLGRKRLSTTLFERRWSFDVLHAFTFVSEVTVYCKVAYYIKNIPKKAIASAHNIPRHHLMILHL